MVARAAKHRARAQAGSLLKPLATTTHTPPTHPPAPCAAPLGTEMRGIDSSHKQRLPE